LKLNPPSLLFRQKLARLPRKKKKLDARVLVHPAIVVVPGREALAIVAAHAPHHDVAVAVAHHHAAAVVIDGIMIAGVCAMVPLFTLD
jgi:hypothetical protein